MSSLNKLYMTRGLPGSGKSTWATEMQKKDPSIVIVNKDDIRKELTKTGWKWSHENEKDVVVKRDGAILNALSSGKSVISSDTNFGVRHESRLREIASKQGAEFEIVDFTKVPLQICIERDARREEGKVGVEVIRKMAEQNGLVEQQAYKPVAGTPCAIICDLDGTLALKGNRSPFDYAKVGKDKVNEPVMSIIRLFSRNGYQIVYCSGREDWSRFHTEDWLETNNAPKGPLFMRPSGDHRNDAIVKRELFDAHIRDKYAVKFVLDNRDRVVKMWRGLGLTCLQVAEGAF